MCFLDFIGALFGWNKDDEELEEKKQPKYTIKKSQMSECEKYFYDIQVNTKDGRVDTVIAPSKFVVMEGISYEW